MLNHGHGQEVSPILVRRQFVAGNSERKLKGKCGTITRGVIC
jgi:hypothetical protein